MTHITTKNIPTISKNKPGKTGKKYDLQRLVIGCGSYISQAL
jgi:hypothetical protein